MTRWTGNPWRRFGLPAAVGWLVVGGYGAAAVVVVASSLFVISWAFVLDRQLREDNGSRLETLTEVFADVVLMTTAILMLSRIRSNDLPSRGLLAGGIATIAISDIALVFQTGVGSY